MTGNEKNLLDEMLDDDSDRLSSWEIEFLESIYRNSVGNPDYVLSNAQQSSFDNISVKLGLATCK